MNTDATKDTALVPVAPALPVVAQVSTRELLESFLSGRSPATMEAYRNDLKDLATFLGVTGIDAASEAVVRSGHGGANLLAIRFKAYLIERGLGSSSVNRKLAALRSLVTLANTLGMVDWSVQVPNLRIGKANVTGVGLRAVRNLIAVAGNERGIKGVRDRAIVRVFFDLALRRAEVCSLDFGDVDLANQRIAVKRKGHTDKTTLTLPEPTCQALREWIDRRGEEPGPLFYTLDHRLLNQRQRLTTCGVYHIVRGLGRKAGFKVHPHQLRHDSITEAVKSAQGSGIGLEEVMDFSGHRQIGTLLIYRDRERNVQGQLAGMVAAKV